MTDALSIGASPSPKGISVVPHKVALILKVDGKDIATCESSGLERDVTGAAYYSVPVRVVLDGFEYRGFLNLRSPKTGDKAIQKARWEARKDLESSSQKA